MVVVAVVCVLGVRGKRFEKICITYEVKFSKLSTFSLASLALGRPIGQSSLVLRWINSLALELDVIHRAETTPAKLRRFQSEREGGC